MIMIIKQPRRQQQRNDQEEVEAADAEAGEIVVEGDKDQLNHLQQQRQLLLQLYRQTTSHGLMVVLSTIMLILTFPTS